MLDLYSEIFRWINADKNFALATVIRTWGSSPRTVGAKMAVNQDGEIVGSVSGGCVEGAVVTSCMETITTGKPQLLHFDVEDETAWEVGLACGGELDVYLEIPSEDFLSALKQAADAETVLTTAKCIKGDKELIWREMIMQQDGKISGSIAPHIDLEVSSQKHSKSSCFKTSTGEEIFLDIIPPLPTLIIVGGVHIAVALTKIARACNYHVIIVDPRRQFGSQIRFPEANQILHLWPDKAFEQIKLTSNTAVAFLTHDPKIDDPGLVLSLPSKAFYIGALGSRTTQTARRNRLQSAGVSERSLARLHGPIGLNLGGRSPEEIALAIMAEIIKTRHQ
jgi:xanthine dehydrogenase accessory factor